MKKITVMAFVMMALLATTGCGYREGVRQPDTQSYIWFSGNINEAVAHIDGNEPIKIDHGYYTNSSGEKVKRDGKTLYEIKPGKHEVVVKKNDKIVVHRVLLINSGATKEVRVP